MHSRVRSLVSSVVALALLGAAPAVHGQGALITGGTRSNFGFRQLGAQQILGAERVSAAVTAGGGLDARSAVLGPGCVGFVTATPDFIATFEIDPSLMAARFIVPGSRGVATLDTTLIVHTPSGEWRCNDDAVGNDPLVQLGGGGAGQYEFWVGTFQAGVNPRGSLVLGAGAQLSSAGATPEPPPGQYMPPAQPMYMPPAQATVVQEVAAPAPGMGSPPRVRIMTCNAPGNTGFLGIGAGRRTVVELYNEGDQPGRVIVRLNGIFPGNGSLELARNVAFVPAHGRANVDLRWTHRNGLVSTNCQVLNP